MAVTITINGNDVPVNGDATALEKAIDAPLFRTWVDRIDPRLVIRSVTIQSVDMFGPTRVGFMKFVADATDEAGNRIPGIVFARGPAVAVLMILVCEGKEYVLLVSQPRVPVGSFDFDEIIAGMTDGDGHVVGVAAKEVQEETEIVLDEDELFPLSERSVPGGDIYPSVGGCDEHLVYYLYRQEVTRERLSELQGKLTGLREEGELITLKVLPIIDAVTKLKDGKFWTAYGLYRAALDQGLIPYT